VSDDASRRTQAERDSLVLALRRDGLTYDAIATKLGYSSHTGARGAYERALRRSVGRELRATMVATEAARLDAYLAAMAPYTAAGEVRAITAAVAISARRSSLLGLDAPKRSEVELLESSQFVQFRDAVMSVLARHPVAMEELRSVLRTIAADGSPTVLDAEGTSVDDMPELPEHLDDE
jgi:hypothetical protein